MCARFGFREWSLPLVESSSLFERSLGEASDVVSKEMYTFNDRSGDSLTLRPEGTAGLVRAVLNAGEDVAPRRPCRAFYCGPMFRYERPQRGRYRQFTQVGAELLGPSCAAADVEAIAMGSELLRDLGVAPAACALHLNTLGDAATRSAYGGALLAYFSARRDELSPHSRERVEGALSREDGRGDAVLRILDSKHTLDRAVAADAPAVDAHLTDTARARFEAVENSLRELNIAYVRDAALVRGLDYYSHTVWEFVDARDQAVVAGGRYDDLARGMLGDDAVGAVGWALGLERLHDLALAAESDGAAALQRRAAPPRAVLVVPLGDGDALHALASRVALRLRRGGGPPPPDVDSSADRSVQQFFDGGGSVKKQLQRATRVEGAAVLVLIGEDELASGAVTLKNLATREQSSVALDGSALEDAVEAILRA